MKTPVVVMLDYTSAFDSVPHAKLLRKLKACGFQDRSHELIESYFEDRKQRLRCSDGLFDTSDIKCGVPQGGSLSSLFFSIYINDLLTKSNEEISYLGYADDTCLLFSFDKEVDRELIARSVAQVREWSRINGLLLNASKSNYIGFHLKKSFDKPPIKIHVDTCQKDHD